jgi:SAM-dependent methyltransferase
LSREPSGVTGTGRASGRSFDRDHGVTTQALFFLSQLGSADGPAHAHATHYEPVPVQAFRALLSHVPEPFARGAAFVDIGSGMGRAVLLASEYPFKQVLGIELSPALHAVASTNLSRARNFTARCRDLRLHCGDARRARLPKGDLVVFLFNPFDDEVLRCVLDRIVLSRSEQDTVILLYHVPVHRDVLLEYRGETIAEGTDQLVVGLGGRAFRRCLRRRGLFASKRSAKFRSR